MARRSLSPETPLAVSAHFKAIPINHFCRQITPAGRINLPQHEHRLSPSRLAANGGRLIGFVAVEHDGACSMRTPMSSHSARKSSMLQMDVGRVVPFVGSDGVSGMRPPNMQARTCQCAKLGTTRWRACRPAASGLQHLARLAGGLEGLAQDHVVEGIVGIVRDRCRHRPGSPTGRWRRRRSRRPG